MGSDSECAPKVLTRRKRVKTVAGFELNDL